jgi:hypothetical protein
VKIAKGEREEVGEVIRSVDERCSDTRKETCE